MDPVSPLPALFCLMVAMFTAFLLVKKFGAPPDMGRYNTIDGLRGYLAFFVFLHHSSIWYFFMRTGQWSVPPSNLYTQLGQGGVLVFFMITGFLFFSKLMDGRNRTIDWGRLFVSRFLRLVPLYLFVVFLLLLVVAYLSGWELREPLGKLIKGITIWLGFTIPGAASLNGIRITPLVVAGVTWSLPYEWLFYFSLPLLALFVGVVPPFRYLALGIICIAGMFMWGMRVNPVLLFSFAGGIATAFLVRREVFRKYATHSFASLVAIGCVTLSVWQFPSAYGFIPILLLTCAFAIIVCGNTLFGILVSPVSRTLGEMAYSIYLLHGLTLFITFVFVLGYNESKLMSPVTHWLTIAAITPVLVTISYSTFRFIENPAMHSATRLTAWLRARLGK